MDDKNIELLRILQAQSHVFPIGLWQNNDNATVNNGCAQSISNSTRATNRLSINLISDDTVKELHEAIALGGDSVKKSLRVAYTDPNQLEVMDALVDVCVAYIGEEVTAVLRKHSNIL